MQAQEIGNVQVKVKIRGLVFRQGCNQKFAGLHPLVAVGFQFFFFVVDVCERADKSRAISGVTSATSASLSLL